MCRRVFLFGAASVLSLAANAADGLVPPDGRQLWPQWQARITVATSQLMPVSLTGMIDAGGAAPAAQLGTAVGDYYFDAPGLRLPRSIGGLRATGGLMAATRGLSWGLAAPRHPSRYALTFGNPSLSSTGDNGPDAVPYLGLGYTGLSAKGGWGVSADLGLIAQAAGGNRPVRSLLGVQSVDNIIGNIRFSPVLQLGVSYSF